MIPDSVNFEKSHVNFHQVEASVAQLVAQQGITSPNNRKAWALKALTLTDLTTLAGDDTKSNVHRLCVRAAYPLSDQTLNRVCDDDLKGQIHTAAVCVYPSRVKDAYEALKKLNKLADIQIAAVATGFPSGQYPLATRLEEIKYAIDQGATEIDIVVDRGLVLSQKWRELYDEIVAMRHACGDRAHLKTILGIGECGTMTNVREDLRNVWNL
jgi:deoxyribose-phosphate aldolase